MTREAEPRSEETGVIKVTRTENPFMEPLLTSGTRLQRFAQIVNGVLVDMGGEPIAQPYVELVPLGLNTAECRVIEFPFRELNQTKTDSLQFFLRSFYGNPNLREGLFFRLLSNEGRGSRLLAHRLIHPQLYYYLNPTSQVNERGNPYRGSGFFILGQQESPFVGFWKVQANRLLKKLPERGIFQIHDLGYLSEAELAYQTVIASIIIAGKLDLSSPEKLDGARPFLRQLFLQIYKQMIVEARPEVKKADIFGADTQVSDIETNLFKPLEEKKGTPMHTLLVGAPGVGKSFVGGYFVTNGGESLVVPLSAEHLNRKDNSGDRTFEKYVLPRLLRIKDHLSLPIVISMDDVETLMEEEISTSIISQSQRVNVEKRSYFLNLLERMMDTHGIFLLCTLNHPDVESAFLRRFNPVYFPLPRDGQRREFLLKIIGQGELPEDEYQGLINDVAAKTQGFSYHSLALIPEYAQNILRAIQDGSSGQDSYSEAIRSALMKARERASLKEIGQFDKAAREMVNKNSPYRPFQRNPA